MTDEPKDYGEPWSKHPEWHRQIVDRHGVQICNYDNEKYAAIQDRAIDCLNACAGIPDPIAERKQRDAEIARLRADCKRKDEALRVARGEKTEGEGQRVKKRIAKWADTPAQQEGRDG